MDILEKTFSEMPEHFTSNQFCARAKQNGLSDVDNQRNIPRTFLLQNATPVTGFNRQWKKKTATSLFSAAYEVDKSIEAAIDTLKKAGYKIMKPTSEWTEV